MNELVLANKTYGLTEWIGQEEKIDILSSVSLLDKNLIDFLSKPENVLEQSETIDIIDADFKVLQKTVDKYDIAFASLSGTVSAAIDFLFVGKTQWGKINFKELSLQDLIKEASCFIDLFKLTGKNIDEAEKVFDEILIKGENKIKNAKQYVEFAHDFASSLNAKGLISSVLENLIGYHFGLDANGHFVISEFEADEIINGSISKRIEAGVLLWIVEQANQYKKTGEFKEEFDEVIKLRKYSKTLKNIISEIADSPLYKENGFDGSKLKKWLISSINNRKNVEDEDMYTLLSCQAIPVVFNRCMVKTYVYVRKFIRLLNEKDVKSFEGLQYLDLSFSSEDARAISRMSTISTGVFAAFDIADAAIPAIKKAMEEFEIEFAKMPAADDRTAFVIAALAGFKGGACEFASRINIANMSNLVTVIKVDWEYIIEDIKRRPHKYAKLYEKTVYETVLPEDLERWTTLNNLETKILYSLEYFKIQADIMNTKDSTKQIEKGNWCKKWVAASEQATSMNKLFEFNKEKLIALIKTYIGNYKENALDTILIELYLFRPYFQLDKEEIQNIKYTDKNFIEETICKEHIVEEKEYKTLIKNYKQHYDDLDPNSINPVVGAIGAAAVVTATGGAAFAFAPSIAVALVGGSFAGLSGAALTSASLAMLGGGALAAGGFGMAGGAIVIAGGGALLGLSATGATAIALSMMTSSKYSRVDYAKLLTNCDYRLLNKYHKSNEVNAIKLQLDKTLEDTITRYSVLKERTQDKEDKKILKEVSKSIEIMSKTSNELGKLLKKAK